MKKACILLSDLLVDLTVTLLVKCDGQAVSNCCLAVLIAVVLWLPWVLQAGQLVGVLSRKNGAVALFAAASLLWAGLNNCVLVLLKNYTWLCTCVNSD